MRTATAALQALINAAVLGQQFEWVQADLYTLYTASGSVLARYTSVDRDLQVNLDGTGGGPTYVGQLNGAPLLKRTSARFGIGTQVEQLQMTLAADASRTINGVPWLQALRNGILDGGRIKLYRFLSDDWSNTAVGAVNWFSGLVGAVGPVGRSAGQIAVNSDLILLNTMMPRELQQPQCANVLYDSKCTVNPASFSDSITLFPGATAVSFSFSSARAAEFFTLGKVAFTSGGNAGLVRSIRANPSTGVVTLVVPVPYPLFNGDTATIYAGCDHSQATCDGKFSNVINFRGAPYTPKPEMVT